MTGQDLCRRPDQPGIKMRFTYICEKDESYYDRRTTDMNYKDTLQKRLYCKSTRLVSPVQPFGTFWLLTYWRLKNVPLRSDGL